MLTLEQLTATAAQVRRNIVEMIWSAGSGHIGGSLSATDIMTALYFREMSIRPEEPEWPERDRFVLSKGHAACALYAVLAERGFFDREILFNEFLVADGRLDEHPDMRKVPGLNMSSGSLGQGISAACGMAWTAKYLLASKLRTYCIVGCGEVQEGQV